MRYLHHKTVLIISPQPWDHIQISKHHYALELAQSGNNVFFLGPPKKNDDHARGWISIRKSKEHDNVRIIDYRPYFPMRVRFHLRLLYRLFMYMQIKLLLKAIKESIDVVWSFEFNLYPDLSAFAASRVIFHPVDPLTNAYQVEVAKDADIIISVSQKILNNFDSADYSGKEKLLVNHGVAKEFVQLASTDEGCRANDVLKVGYVGNLDRKIIDWGTIKNIVVELPRVEFHFWGPYSVSNKNVEVINRYGNVVLHGQTPKKSLAIEMSKIDCFILLYLEDFSESDLSNSHKILEYFSTGSVVFSVPIEEYREQERLMVITRSVTEPDKTLDFKKCIARITELNRESLVRSRKALALSNSYTVQVGKIDQVLAAS